MIIREIEAKSILRKHRKIDSWFISHYGMNLYRGCTHNCAYCDGRSEDYMVEGEFGEKVFVKVNAIEILRRELDPRRRHTPLKRSFIMLGGGVGDSYQPAEAEYQLTRRALQLMHEYKMPVHILTKSTLIRRDADILRRINEQNRAIVSFSLSSADDKISALFEPGVPPPSERLEALAFFSREDIPTGVFLLPVIPFITDSPELIEETIEEASKAGVNFIIFGGMTLKHGKQKHYFLRVLQRNYPGLVKEYENIYKNNRWGQASQEYYNSINSLFNKAASKHKIPKRVPPRLYKDILSENDLVIVILEHIDYLLKLDGKPSSFSRGAPSISKLTQPLSTMNAELTEIQGIGEKTEQIILEILKTGTSTYYENLLAS